ncbi:hypothetical protein AUP68_08138 [Ilyonectria robusta]
MSPDPVRFRCAFAGCSRSYKRKEHLLRHQRDHANRRPFACKACQAAFNRRDLLARHLVLSHSEPPLQVDDCEQVNESPIADDGTKTNPDKQIGAVSTTEGVAVVEGLDLLGASSLLEATNRSELLALYFSDFHPHWPVLHEKSFRGSPQPPKLMVAVLVTGLWMLKTPEAQAKATSYHDALLEELEEDMASNAHPSLNPRPELLVGFQTLMILTIVSTFKLNGSFFAVMVFAKIVFRYFDRGGVHDQAKINAASSDPIIRESYQRLALVHFKLHVHISSLQLTFLPQVKPFDFFHPQLLRVRVPSTDSIWKGASIDNQDVLGSSFLVGSLFDQSSDLNSRRYISLVVAWDFPLGMILGCFLTRQPSESYVSVLQRIKPYIFSHS